MPVTECLMEYQLKNIEEVLVMEIARILTTYQPETANIGPAVDSDPTY